MSIRWIMFVLAVFVLGAVVLGIPEGQYMTNAQGDIFKQVGTINIFSFEWVTSMGTLLSWDYSIFKNVNGSANNWAILRIPLSIVTGAFLITLGLIIVPALIRGVGGAFGFIARLFTGGF